MNRAMDGLHDPLLASALHIRTDASGVVLISLDVYGLEAYTCGQICEMVEEATGTPRDQVFIGCTNNHSAPATVWSYAWKGDPTVGGPDSRYIETIKNAAVRAAASACATTRPVEYAPATITFPAPDGAGAVGTDVLAFREQGTGTYAAVVIVSGLQPATVDPDSPLRSADFPYFVREQLMERYGRQLVVLHFTAPCAGQRFSYFAGPDPFARAQAVGSAMGRAVVAAVDAAAWNPLPGFEVHLRSKEVSLPFRNLPSVEAAEAALKDAQARQSRLREEGAGKDVLWQANAAVAQADGVLTLTRQQRDGTFDQIRLLYGAAAIRALPIGDATLVGLPGNLAPEFARQLKNQSKGRVFVAAHVNGFLQGDVMDTDTEARGEFGRAPSPFSAAVGEHMVRAALELMSPP
jgi:hypothetical protein